MNKEYITAEEYQHIVTNQARMYYVVDAACSTLIRLRTHSTRLSSSPKSIMQKQSKGSSKQYKQYRESEAISIRSTRTSNLSNKNRKNNKLKAKIKAQKKENNDYCLLFYYLLFDF